MTHVTVGRLIAGFGTYPSFPAIGRAYRSHLFPLISFRYRLRLRYCHLVHVRDRSSQNPRCHRFGIPIRDHHRIVAIRLGRLRHAELHDERELSNPYGIAAAVSVSRQVRGLFSERENGS